MQVKWLYWNIKDLTSFVSSLSLWKNEYLHVTHLTFVSSHFEFNSCIVTLFIPSYPQCGQQGIISQFILNLIYIVKVIFRTKYINILQTLKHNKVNRQLAVNEERISSLRLNDIQLIRDLKGFSKINCLILLLAQLLLLLHLLLIHRHFLSTLFNNIQFICFLL